MSQKQTRCYLKSTMRLENINNSLVICVWRVKEIEVRDIIIYDLIHRLRPSPI